MASLWKFVHITVGSEAIVNFIGNSGLDITPTREQFLFGFQNILSYSPKNYICLVLKKYIWRTKFKSAILTMVGFKSQLKSYLCDLKYVFKFRNMPNQFNEWNNLYDAL